ncbi:MAG: integrase arm-type DNA-binding domain-containing protein [Sphingomonas sp.]
MGKLTALKIRSLAEPGRYADGDGLFLDVTGKASGRWILRVQSNGRRREIGLGSLKNVSLADARDAAFVTRKKIAQGIDPVAERKQERQAIPTFRKAAELVHEEHEKAWKNGKHQNQWIATLKTYAFPKMGDLLVSDIEGPLIRDVLAPIWLTKPETARRVRQRIGTVLDWSYARGFRATEAPMRSLSKGLPRQPKRDNHFAALPYASVPEFLEKLGERESVGRIALEALILTAARSGEIRGATWSELDLEAGLWTVPAARMKMGRAHLVPLSAEVIAVFQRAEKFHAGASDLVFPGQNVKKPLSDMTLLKILRDMELGVTVHGFRSAFRDWAAEQTDYSGEVAEAALAHTVSNKVEAAYRRTDFLDKRRLLMRDWATFCKKVPAPSNQIQEEEQTAVA